MFFARYAAKLAICCPFALLCYLPLSGFLRLPLKKLAALSALGVAAYIGIGVAFTLLGSILLTTFEHPIMLISERIFTDFSYRQIVQTVLGTAFVYFAVQIAIFHVVSERILSLKLNLE